MPHPHGLVVWGGIAYVIDAGELLAIPLREGGQASRIMPAQNQVENLPLGELIGLSLSPDGGALVLLDKRGDIYRYEPASGRWGLERLIDQRHTSPNPALVSLAPYDSHLYILDIAYSQVWRYPFGEGVSESYLPGPKSPWERVDTALDLTRGVALAVDGDVYVPLREGINAPAGLARFSGASLQRDTAFAPGLVVERPTSLYLDPAEEGPLYLLDQEGKRLRALERRTGQLLCTYTLAEPAAEMRAVYVQESKLYIATAGAIYVYPGAGQRHAIAGGVGPLLEERPDNPQRLAVLAALSLPITNILYLPERDSLLPGASRVYRYGIHYGLDMYGGTMGVAIPYGTPVLAAADGVVIRADQDFQEMAPAESEELIALCLRLHYTPAVVLDSFRGRQVWLDHGGGLATHYAHLAGIPPEVVAGAQVRKGQVIGYVGNSGTSDGVAGNKEGAHLHFEIILGNDYVGKWLSLVEVRRILQRYLFQ